MRGIAVVRALVVCVGSALWFVAWWYAVAWVAGSDPVDYIVGIALPLGLAGLVAWRSRHRDLAFGCALLAGATVAAVYSAIVTYAASHLSLVG